MSETLTVPEGPQEGKQEADKQGSDEQKPLDKSLEELFPTDRFTIRTRYTKPGSTKGLKGITQELTDSILEEESDIGVITIEKLPDGGCKVIIYTTNK